MTMRPPPVPAVTLDDYKHILHPTETMTHLERACANASTRVAAAMDAAIKQALDDALGAGRWTPETVKHRCTRVPGNWPTGDTYMLDGCPLLRFEFVPPPLDLDSRMPQSIELKMNVVRFDWKPLP